MSQYTSYQYETEPEVNAGALAAAAGLAGLLAAGVASLAARSLRLIRVQTSARLAQLEETGQSPVTARLGALRESPLLEASVLKEFSRTSGLPEVGRDGLLDQLRNVESSRLDSLINQGNSRLLQGQARVLRDSVTEVLTGLGYEIRTPKRPLSDLVVVRGVRESDNTTITVRLTPKDEKLETDLSGFNGGACTRVLADFEDRMRRRGVELRLANRKPHGCAGGFLTQEADHVLDSDSLEGKCTAKNTAPKVRAARARFRTRN